ncbi:MAG: hypothetical protein EB060_05795 [Proteobacteria bacterium]|nr:hypothetical protein [Pseudomonadota bacterium]
MGILQKVLDTALPPPTQALPYVIPDQSADPHVEMDPKKTSAGTHCARSRINAALRQERKLMHWSVKLGCPATTKVEPIPLIWR